MYPFHITFLILALLLFILPRVGIGAAFNFDEMIMDNDREGTFNHNILYRTRVFYEKDRRSSMEKEPKTRRQSMEKIGLCSVVLSIGFLLAFTFVGYAEENAHYKLPSPSASFVGPAEMPKF